MSYHIPICLKINKPALFQITDSHPFGVGTDTNNVPFLVGILLTDFSSQASKSQEQFSLDLVFIYDRPCSNLVGDSAAVPLRRFPKLNLVFGQATYIFTICSTSTRNRLVKHHLATLIQVRIQVNIDLDNNLSPSGFTDIKYKPLLINNIKGILVTYSSDYYRI